MRKLLCCAVVLLSACDKEKPPASVKTPEAAQMTPQIYHAPDPNLRPVWRLNASTQFGAVVANLVPSPPEYPYQPLTWSGMGGPYLWTLCRLDDGTWQVCACYGLPGSGRAVGYWQLSGDQFNASAPNQLRNPADALLPVTVTPL